MAHFAEIDDNNLVTRVLVTDNNMPNEGYNWLISRLGGRWIKTSYNTFAGQHKTGGTPLRKNFAGIGFTYDEQRDAFIPPKPFDSWLLDEEACQWVAPVPYPTDGKIYGWDEEAGDWVEVTPTKE
jgi:hypothetical protein